MYAVGGLYYPCSENKNADQLRVFVFAYAKIRFSHDAAHVYLQIMENDKSKPSV